MNKFRQIATIGHWLAIITVLTLCLTGCSKPPARFQPSGLNSSFELEQSQPFANYVEHYRKIIEQTRGDLHGWNTQKIINANTPFELGPNEEHFGKDENGNFGRGIVLIHGLSDSPYHMRSLAEHFRDQGFLTRVILLPGHGTRPGDLTKVTIETWLKATEYAIKSMQSEVDQLFIGGYSLGGALAVHYALLNQKDLSGLFLFNPCLKVRTKLAWLSGPLNTFKTWLVVKQDQDFARYESFATNSGKQVNRLINKITELTRKKGRRLTIPVFTAVSLEDATVDPWHTLEFFREDITNPDSRLLLYTAEEPSPRLADPRIAFSSSSLPAQKIIGFSHQSITITPDDPHYGSNGEYRNCLHYGRNSSKFKKCQDGESAWLGERTISNKGKGILQRLTWNPKFQEMLDEIDNFLQSIP
ncbi:MAG: alpha/beta fold hydrolase [Desulfobulbaceae bacterium]|nr:alpha/beta fold hydrolase [Desulfobulbaceae bacterium]